MNNPLDNISNDTIVIILIFVLVIIISMIIFNNNDKIILSITGTTVIFAMIWCYMKNKSDKLHNKEIIEETDKSSSETTDENEADKETTDENETDNEAVDENEDDYNPFMNQYKATDEINMAAMYPCMACEADTGLFNRMKYMSIQPQLSQVIRAGFNVHTMKPFFEEELREGENKHWWENNDYLDAFM